MMAIVPDALFSLYSRAIIGKRGKAGGGVYVGMGEIHLRLRPQAASSGDVDGWTAVAAAARKGLQRVSRSLKIDCCSRLPLHGPLWTSTLKLWHVR